MFKTKQDFQDRQNAMRHSYCKYDFLIANISFLQQSGTSADKVNKFCFHLSRTKDNAYGVFIEFLQTSDVRNDIVAKLKQLERNE